MKGRGLSLWLGAAVLLALGLAIVLGEVALPLDAYARALGHPQSPEGIVLWQIRAPRAVLAIVVGGALGLSGGLLQGLLRNPLADPGVLGVSGVAGMGAALALVLGLAGTPGLVEGAAWIGAALAGLVLVAFTRRFREPQSLILFGVALSSFSGAVTALIFNLSPSPIATAEVMAWLLGAVENRGWPDVLWALPPLMVAAVLSGLAAPALRQLTLGEDAAEVSGLDMRRLRIFAILAAALATGAAVAGAGGVGFVGLAAPHLVRRLVREDPAAVLMPSAVAGGLILVVADLIARVVPTDQPLKLGVVTALIGAPLFAALSWRVGRSWRA